MEAPAYPDQLDLYCLSPDGIALSGVWKQQSQNECSTTSFNSLTTDETNQFQNDASNLQLDLSSSSFGSGISTTTVLP
jgi:hypothetical protein